MTDKAAPMLKKPIGRRMLMSRPGVVLVTGLLALAVGYVSGSSGRSALAREAEQLGQRLDTVSLDLRLYQAESTLATAVVEATYGSFEDARASSGAFFDSLSVLRQAVAPVRDSAFSEISARRDDIQALLGRKEPIAKDQLADVLTRFQTILTGRSIRFEIPTGLPETGSTN